MIANPKYPTVAVMFDISSAYGRGILRGIAKYARSYGPWVFIRVLPTYLTLKQGHPNQRLLIHDIDGIMGPFASPKEARELIPPGIPAVLSFYNKMGKSHYSTIVGDYKNLGVTAAEYFLSRGFRRFAYCGFEDKFWSRLTGDSFISEISKKGFEFYRYKCPKSKKTLWSDERQEIAKWLSNLPKPIAVMACNDDRAQHILEACKVARLHVPEEVAVLGSDNDDLICDLSTPSLSSIPYNYEKAGFEIAKLLDELMKNKNGGKQKNLIISPMAVVTRQSTDIMAIEDKEIAMAMRYIRQHAKEKIQIDDVVETISISRRELYNRFQRILNRSVHEEIIRVRVAEIANMLVETNLTISQIAVVLGENSDKHIARIFRSYMGMSPIEYRKKMQTPTI
ncbi:MAG: DNA-binding transcriptional regulator [Planctomycetaceae bacterium]|nr:DNA-binding transcriptional regulator [Planctomycetaceae bacterium]